MSNSDTQPAAGEYAFAQSERTRILQDIVNSHPHGWAYGWGEAIASAAMVYAINMVLSGSPLSAMEGFFVTLGFVAPVALLVGRLYRSERRTQALIQLLKNNGNIPS